MIYNTSFMRKELRNAYTQQKFSRNRQFSLGLFLGLGRVEPEAGQLRFVKSFLEQEGTP